MKKWIGIAVGVVVLAVVAVSITGTVAKPDNPPGQDCKTIQSGLLVDSMGETITPGYNRYGYNYQAKITNQGIEEYCQQRNDIPETNPSHWDYDDCMAYFGNDHFELIMKWNDAWLSNKDCDEDGLLDRHYGNDSYRDSGAWLTNHQKGTYQTGKKTHHWEYFVKIIAAPEDAQNINGVWHAADGTEIGPVIWGSFATIQRVYNDTGTGEHGVEFLSPDHAGLGGW